MFGDHLFHESRDGGVMDEFVRFFGPFVLDPFPWQLV